MDLSPHIQSLRDDLMAAAALGDEDIRRAAALLGTAIEPATRLAMMSALSELASEVTSALHDISVKVHLDGRDVQVSVNRSDRPSPAAAPDQAEPEAGSGPEGWDAGFGWGHPDGFMPRAEDFRRAMQDAGGELSRTTVRLFNDLKTQAERAAADQGVSLNTYISRAVSDSVRNAVPPGVRGPRSPRRDRRDPGGQTVSGFFQA